MDRLKQPRGAERRVTPGKTNNMAADWIPMRIDLRDDPAVIAIAAATKLDPDAVVGKLLRVWGWANRQLKSGNAPVTLESWIDHFAGAPDFAAAMKSVGWLALRHGKLIFPKFERWNSQSAKQRSLAAERQRRFRNAKSNAPVTQIVTPTGQDRTGEKKTSKPSAADKPPKEQKPRPRCEVFDSLAVATGSDPAVTGSHIAKIRNALLKAEPPYTPAEVQAFATRIAEFCPWTEGRRPTLGEVEKYIGLLRNGQGTPKPRQGGFRTQDDRTMDLLESAMGDQP